MNAAKRRPAAGRIARALESGRVAAVAPVTPGRPPLAWFALLALIGAALLGHAWFYRFLTDDSFISFRYARNLSHGFGLVFNPGGERVEGYSNFLWVTVLAALDRLGWAPERAAIPLSLLLTAGLLAVVAISAWRTRLTGAPWWTALAAPLLLAATRSVAVWSTSGLETRCFEFFAVAAALRLREEVAVRRRHPATRRAPWSPWLFGLASLTRPDGPLLAVAAVGVALMALAARDRRIAIRFLLAQWPFLLLVGGHLVFRLAYYGDWLPNTYYAKVGGRTWWSMGGLYLLTFALEYAAWIWLPLAVAGAWRRVRLGDGPGVAIFAAVVVPHAIYVASIGGDHFEYRPLDLYFPLLFLLVGDGLGAIARRRAGNLLAAGALAVVLLGLWHLPWRSHTEFPDVYISGFPGLGTEPPARGRYLDPDRDPVDRLPGLRLLAAAHRSGVQRLTHRFVGVRQEEHRLFLDVVRPIGFRLRRLVADGLLPRDLYFATPSVGAVPYESDLRTLDELGLTDRTVARMPGRRERIMAHDRQASPEYLRARGVDIRGLRLFVAMDSPTMVSRVRDALVGADTSWAAAVSDSEMLVCGLPSGIESARRRMPRLEFHRLDDPAVLAIVAAHALPRRRREFEARPADDTALELATALLVCGHFDEALPFYEALTQRFPDRPLLWENLAMGRLGLHDLAGGLAAMEHAARVAADIGDADDAARLEMRRARIAEALARTGAPR